MIRVVLPLFVVAAGCGVVPAPDFAEMTVQHKAKPLGASPYFEDGRAMRPPPEGTVARDAVLGPRAMVSGRDDAGRYVASIPVPLDRAALDRGRTHFEVYCAACHGVLGDGESEVARHMALRRPPSLVSAQVTAFPAGRLFEVIGEGYGLMPSYRQQLPIDDRWEVVAYVEALGLGRAVRLTDLPPTVRSEAERALGGVR